MTGPGQSWARPGTLGVTAKRAGKPAAWALSTVTLVLPLPLPMAGVQMSTSTLLKLGVMMVRVLPLPQLGPAAASCTAHVLRSSLARVEPAPRLLLAARVRKAASSAKRELVSTVSKVGTGWLVHWGAPPSAPSRRTTKQCC